LEIDMSAITVTETFRAYNDRRYGKPWGAIITFTAAKPEYNFKAGSYLGGCMGGEVVIQCQPGDLVAIGQKDFRNPRKTDNDWYVVGQDGTLSGIDRADALRHYQAEQKRRANPPKVDNQPPQGPSAPSKAALEAELAALEARRAEILKELSREEARPATQAQKPHRRAAGVMARAWALCRAKVAQLGGKAREYFRDCLKAAWAEVPVVA
jgi:hypothetical protein